MCILQGVAICLYFIVSEPHDIQFIELSPCCGNRQCSILNIAIFCRRTPPKRQRILSGSEVNRHSVGGNLSFRQASLDIAHPIPLGARDFANQKHCPHSRYKVLKDVVNISAEPRYCLAMQLEYLTYFWSAPRLGCLCCSVPDFDIRYGKRGTYKVGPPAWRTYFRLAPQAPQRVCGKDRVLHVQSKRT